MSYGLGCRYLLEDSLNHAYSCLVSNYVQTMVNIIGVLAPASEYWPLFMVLGLWQEKCPTVFSALRAYALLPNKIGMALCAFLLLFAPGFTISVRAPPNCNVDILNRRTLSRWSVP